MRRAVLGVLATLAITAAPALAQAPLKIGFINSQALLAQAPGAAEASQQFDQELGTMRAQLQPMAEELDSMISQFEAQSMTLSEQARRHRQQEAQQHRNNRHYRPLKSQPDRQAPRSPDFSQEVPGR